MAQGLERIQNVAALPTQSRVFVGLWPEDALQPTLLKHAQHAQQHCGGRVMRDHHWHITLAYVGVCSREQVTDVAQAVKQLSLSLPPLTLSQYGAFKNARVVWLGPDPQSVAPEVQALHQAHQQVWQRLHALGWRNDERGYVPHVSLLRDAQAAGLSALQLEHPLRWHHRACYVIASFPERDTNRYVIVDDVRLA